MRKRHAVFPIAGVLLFGGALFAEDGSIARDGLTLYYRTEGSGKPIVFLSGGPGLEVDYMKPAADLFPREFQRVFLEQRGTGRSRPAKLTAEHMTLRLMVEDIEALRLQLKQERLLIAGHSWGGMLAMAYAAAHPDRVDEMILIDPGGPTREFFGWFADNIEARMHAEDKEAREYWSEAAKHGMDPQQAAYQGMRAITPAYFFDRAKGLAFAASVPKESLHADAGGLLQADLAKSYDLREGLRKLSRPVLILQGHQDPIGDKTVEDIHALIQSSTLRYIDRCGHFPWIEQPEAMRTAIAEFLKSPTAAVSRHLR